MDRTLPLALVLLASTGTATVASGCSRSEPEAEKHEGAPNKGGAVRRMSYAESCAVLQQLGILNQGAPPRMPTHMPRHDDADAGVSFFRTVLENVRLESLTLSRTFIGRSEIRNVSFQDSDLSESSLCWNNFTGANLTGTILRDADFRASEFRDVNFERADLSGADLRHSSFVDCRFRSANLKGAKLTRAAAKDLRLTQGQQEQVSWQNDEGPEPEGG